MYNYLIQIKNKSTREVDDILTVQNSFANASAEAHRIRASKGIGEHAIVAIVRGGPVDLSEMQTHDLFSTDDQ